MKRYRFFLSIKASNQINKLDNSTKILLDKWINKHLKNIEDPRSFGKAIIGMKNLWRYRIGNYRLIVEINDNELTIIALEFSHRSTVYKR